MLSPNYAPAFSGLADAYAVLGFYDYLSPAQAFPRAKAAAQRAVDLDPRLAHAHASLGYVALYHDWNWAASEAAFERAIALNPSYSVGHQWYANYLTARGRFDEAVAAMRRAQEVDPLSLIASAALGWVHFYQRDYDAAVEQCRRTLELNPRFELAHLWAGWAHEAAGRYADAVRHLTEAVHLSSDGAVALASLGRAQALAGDRAGALQTLAKLNRTHGAYRPAFEVAKLHLALGERDEAIAWLRRAHAERSHSIVFLSVDPQLDLLRHDARFVELESRIATAPKADAVPSHGGRRR
jgi:tetratricopeptide (TPR) repeat protein